MNALLVPREPVRVPARPPETRWTTLVWRGVDADGQAFSGSLTTKGTLPQQVDEPEMRIVVLYDPASQESALWLP